MFLSSFAWSFVLVSLPFHIHHLSRLDEAATLRWTGWILGISSLVTVVTAPLWGRLGGRGHAKALFVMVQAGQGIGFLGTAMASTLLELFLWRLLIGLLGAGSTFVFITAGRSDNPAAVRRQIATIQSGMTIGQVIGPLAGAVVAARIGFRASFVVGALILFGCAALAHWGLEDSAGPDAAQPSGRRVALSEIVGVTLIVLGGSTQLFFLTAILPQVLPALGIAADHTLEVGGILLFVSGAAAAAGAVLAGRLGDLAPERRLIMTLLALSAVSVAALGAVSSVWLYGILRFLEVLCIAPVFPIVVAAIAMNASGEVIGFLNSARIGAQFLGPVLATSMLAWASPGALYVALALMTLACVPLVGGRRPAHARSGGGSVR
jgi:MFS transporter, DHA1 family, multidrug resistance protein